MCESLLVKFCVFAIFEFKGFGGEGVRVCMHVESIIISWIMMRRWVRKILTSLRCDHYSIYFRKAMQLGWCHRCLRGDGQHEKLSMLVLR